MPEQRFGFTVEHAAIHDYVDGQDVEVGRGWAVYLPHQCGAWGIAGGEYEPVSQAEAVAELERFIAEAQVALAALRDGREIAEEDDRG